MGKVTWHGWSKEGDEIPQSSSILIGSSLKTTGSVEAVKQTKKSDVKNEISKKNTDKKEK